MSPLPPDPLLGRPRSSLSRQHRLPVSMRTRAPSEGHSRASSALECHQVDQTKVPARLSLRKGDAGHPVVEAAALLAEQTELLQGRVLPCILIRILNLKKKIQGSAMLVVGQDGLGDWRGEAVGTLTEMRMQCRSPGAPPSSSAPTIAASLCTSPTRTMSMSFSQQNAWINVKWICSAMSPSSSSSAASTQKVTLSGSLQSRWEGQGQSRCHPQVSPPRQPQPLHAGPFYTHTFRTLADS